MPEIWCALKRSLQCKSEPGDVHDPKRPSNNLTNISTTRKSESRSGCSRSIANLKDVIHGSKRHTENKPDPISPRSIGSSELLNPMTHNVVLDNSTSELKITTNGFALSEGSDVMEMDSLGSRAWKPGRSSSSLSSQSPGFGAIVNSRASSFGSNNSSFRGLCCHKCGEHFGKLDAAEEHYLTNHAVTELSEGDSSRKIVEMICQAKPDTNPGGIEKILKVHNLQRVLAKFEEHRELVKIKANNLTKKHPRCLADGNELLRFHGATVQCSLGLNGCSTLCISDKCHVCRILRHGFSYRKELNGGIGVFTASTSRRAFESIPAYDDGSCTRKALIVCRVIAGRVHRPLDNIQEMAGQSGFDSLAGKVGTHSNIEELYLLSPRALLPCFVVIYKSGK